jgi:type I pantothenate kinase
MDLQAYSTFTRREWSALRFNTPLTLSEADLVALSGLNEVVSEQEVVEVYLPLSRLLNLHVRAARQLGAVKDEFLGRFVRSPPASRSARAPSRVSCRRSLPAGPTIRTSSW